MQSKNLRSIQDLHEQINLMMKQQQQAPPPPMCPPYCPPTFDPQAFHMQYSPQYYPPVLPHMYAAQHGANKENEDLRKQLQDLTAALANTNKNCRNGPRSCKAKTKRTYTNDNYCWTHGYNVADNHSSATCKNPGPGHQPTATRTNTMNGSTRDKDLPAAS